MAVHIDQCAVELVQHQCDRIERRVETGQDLILIRWEGDIGRHIQDDAVTHAGDGNAGSLQLRPQFGLLLVHVIADCAACESANTRPDERRIAAANRRVSDSKTGQRAKTGTNGGTARSVGNLLLARIWSVVCRRKDRSRMSRQ